MGDALVITPPPKARWEDIVEKRLAAKRQAAQEEAAKQAETFDANLVPEQPFQLTPEQQEADTFIDNIDIVDAYVKFGGKARPRVLPGQVENIKARCPNPSHADVHESYWMNRDKNTGNCGVCGGMDVKDIAAYHFGYPVPEYKSNGDFPKLMREIAESYGFHFERTLGGETVIWREPEDNPNTSDTRDTQDKTDKPDIPDNSDETDKTDIPDPRAALEVPTISAVPDNVEDLFGDDELEIQLPTFDWHQVAPGTDTFIDIYMAACRKDESPEEYHLFNALLAVAFTAGREVGLRGRRTVYGNLFVCALGKTGSGKSSAEEHLRVLLKRVHPYKHDDPTNTGVDTITPASGESLIKAFSKPIYDPVNPKIIAYHAPVKGLVGYNELSSLIGRSSKMGNIIKPTLMDFYDMRAEVKTQSNTGGKIIAEHPFACCTTTAQPKALRDLLGRNDDESGFLNRWLFVSGTRKQSTIMGQGPVDLTAAADALERIKGWAGSFTGGALLEWEDDALERMESFLQGPVQKLKDDPDTDIYTRLDLLLQKLCLLLTVNKMERSVTLETVLTVLRLFPYLRSSYGVIAGQLGSSLENDITNAIVYQMKRLGDKDGVSLNILHKALKRRNYPKELILRNVKALIELGYVEERKPSAGTRGRPSIKYVYVA